MMSLAGVIASRSRGPARRSKLEDHSTNHSNYTQVGIFHQQQSSPIIGLTRSSKLLVIKDFPLRSQGSSNLRTIRLMAGKLNASRVPLHQSRDSNYQQYLPACHTIFMFPCCFDLFITQHILRVCVLQQTYANNTLRRCHLFKRILAKFLPSHLH